MTVEELAKRATEWGDAIIAGALATAGSAALWLVRRILTDTKRLSLLEQRQEMQHKEVMAAIGQASKRVEKIEKSNQQTADTQAMIADVLTKLEQRGVND